MIKKLYNQRELFICLFLGFTFLGSGMAKLYYEHAYLGWIGPTWLEAELKPHGLGLYARFIGYAQVVIGYLLFTFRYRILGAVMAVPLIGNILMVTISMEWRGTPYVLAVLLVMNLFILYRNRYVLNPLIGLSGTLPQTLNARNSLIWLSGLMLNLMSIHISYSSIYAAWGVSLIGLFISFYASHLDKKFKSF
ncbi:MAG: hypothetical protein AB8B73_02490 [Ekhidna sp.]